MLLGTPDPRQSLRAHRKAQVPVAAQEAGLETGGPSSVGKEEAAGQTATQRPSGAGGEAQGGEMMHWGSQGWTLDPQDRQTTGGTVAGGRDEQAWPFCCPSLSQAPQPFT